MTAGRLFEKWPSVPGVLLIHCHFKYFWEIDSRDRFQQVSPQKIIRNVNNYVSIASSSVKRLPRLQLSRPNAMIIMKNGKIIMNSRLELNLSWTKNPSMLNREQNTLTIFDKLWWINHKTLRIGEAATNSVKFMAVLAQILRDLLVNADFSKSLDFSNVF